MENNTLANELKAVYAKWKDVCTLSGGNMWTEFFNDCMEYTVDDLMVIAKYFNVATVLDKTTGIGATDLQDAMNALCATEVLDYVALERELLRISTDKREIARVAYLLSTGQVV